MRARGDAALRALHAALRRRRRSRPRGRRAAEFAAARARADARSRSRRSSARSPTSSASTPRRCRSRCRVETMPGVRCERIIRPDLGASACTCRPGSAPLPSTVDHAGRARRASPAVRARVLCTPPQPRGRRQCRGAGRGRAVRHRDGVQGRRRAGDRRAGLRHRERAEGRQDLRARQRLGDGGQAARSRPIRPAPRSICPPVPRSAGDRR